MPVGRSGRIVVEVDTGLKRTLYAELAREGSTLKEWFTREAERYVRASVQQELFVAESAPPAYAAKAKRAPGEGGG
jgi:hypothetical protein